MFSTPVLRRTARIDHRCTNCGQPIEAGKPYERWASFDDAAFTNKMHPECFESLVYGADGGQFEYTPFSGERPEQETP